MVPFVLPAVLMVCAVGAIQMASLIRDRVPGVRGVLVAGVLPAILVCDALAYQYLYYNVQHGETMRRGASIATSRAQFAAASVGSRAGSPSSTASVGTKRARTTNQNWMSSTSGVCW